MSTAYKDLSILTAYCGLIFWLSSRSGIPAPHLFPHQDKLVHFALYAIMGWLAWRFLRHLFEQKTVLIWATIGFCSLYGITDEYHQSWVANRTSDPWDWLADTLGAAVAAVWVASDKMRLNNREKKIE